MLYHLTQSLVKLSIHGFYRKIHVANDSSLDFEGPAIFIANHPSALIDPLVIASITSRRLSFIAAAEYFSHGYKAWILKHEFNMIPVYRPNKYSGEIVNNEDMFLHCYECLDKNGCIVIFPEGNSITEKHLRPFKTGVARIITGFHKVNPRKQVKVIPVGLNYADTHRFQSDVFVSIGPPQTFDIPLKLDQETEKEIIYQITNALYESLKSEVLHFENRPLEEVVEDVSKLWRTRLLRDLNVKNEDILRKFRIEQDLIKATELLHEQTPQKITALHQRIKSFLNKSDAEALSYLQRPSSLLASIFVILKLILVFPLAFLGASINLIPYTISRHLFRKVYRPKIKDYDVNSKLTPAFEGTLSFAIAIAIFLLWYLQGSLLLSVFITWWAGPAFFFGSYLLGQTALSYLGWITSLKNIFSIRRRFNRLKKDIPDLEVEKDALITELLQFKNEYETLTK